MKRIFTKKYHYKNTNYCHAELVSASPELEIPNQVRNDRRRIMAFTLAEVLITLTIIGVIAALTIPNLMQKYKKHIVEVKLKQTYSILSQALNRATTDYGPFEEWPCSNSLNFIKNYILPYIKYNSTSWSKATAYAINNGNSHQIIYYWQEIKLPNGAILYSFLSGDVNRFVIDVNGEKGPNIQGHDLFNFYWVKNNVSVYAYGAGHVMYNIPKGGLYYDGYGKNSQNIDWDSSRGCQRRANNFSQNDNGAHCIAKIIRNGWKIPANYPVKKF